MTYPLPRDREKLPLVTKPMTALSAGGIFDNYKVRRIYPRVRSDQRSNEFSTNLNHIRWLLAYFVPSGSPLAMRLHPCTSLLVFERIYKCHIIRRTPSTERHAHMHQRSP